MCTRSRVARLRSRPLKRRALPWRSLLLWVVAVWASGCQGPFGAGLQAFDEARYPEAAAELRTVDQRSLDQRERTRLALYLGLSELALGNLHRARPRLQEARCGVVRDPDALRPSERGRLDAAWHSVGVMPGEAVHVDTPCDLGAMYSSW